MSTNSPNAPKTDSRGEYIPLNDYDQLAKKLGYEDSGEVLSDTEKHELPDKKPHIKTEETNNDLEKKEPAMVGFFSLFRYCSAGEKLVVFLGCIIAAIPGIMFPGISVVCGIVIDEMVKFSRNTLAENCTTNYTNLCHEITDDFIYQTSQPCLWLLGVGFLTMISTYLSMVMFNLLAANQAFKIRCMFLSSVLKQDVGWYDTNKTGDFAHKLTGDLEIIQNGIGDKIAICARFVSTTTLTSICGIYYGWKLALVTLAFSPVPMFAMAVISKKQASAARGEMEAYSAAGSVAEEVLAAIRTVAAFGGEKKEVERYERSLIPAMKKGILRGLITSVGHAFSNSSMFVFYAIGFGYGVHLFLEEWGAENPTYSPGVIVNVFGNMLVAAISIGYSSAYFEAFGMARGAACKIFEIIDRKPLIDSSLQSGKKPPDLNGRISLKDVHFKYPARPEVPVLKCVTLNIEPEQTVALVGPSGCGKSTIIQLILRFYDVDSGSVNVGGNNVKDLNVGWLRDNISLVGQEPFLFSTTIEANILHGKPDATPEEVVKAAKLANIHDFIESLQLKYQTLVGERGTQLSGGQKQRIAIARAIIKNPKILLLDEATSALDTESEAVVQAALEEASLGRTTLVVAHRLSTIRNADKIVVLKDGEVQEVGSHNELIKRHGAYYNLVLAQTAEVEKKEGFDNSVKDSKVIEEHKKLSTKLVTCIGDPNEIDGNISDTFVEKEDEEKVIPSKTRILKLCAQEWPYIVVGSIAASIIGVYQLSIGIVFGAILGLLKEEKDEIEAKYGLFCGLFMLLAVTCFMFSFLQVFMFVIAGERLTCRLRKMVFTTILSQDMAFFDYQKNSVGSLCSRLSSDASDIQGAAGLRISTIIQSFSAITACIFISFWYSYILALVVVPFIPLFTLAIYFENRVNSGQMDSEKSTMEEATKIAVEAIGSIRTVASLHQEEAICKQFRNALYDQHKKSRFKSHARSLTYSIGQSIQLFYCSAAIFCGARLIADGQLHYEDFLKVFEGISFGAFAAGQALAFAPEYQKGKLAAVRIFKLLDLKSRINAFSEDGQFLKTINGDIRFQEVHFNYPSRPDQAILKGLNLEIESGKTVALVGSSGCGKSTCVQLIERLYDVTSGKVMVDGVNVAEMNVGNLRSHLGLVSQEPVLFSCSIAENIAYGDNSRTLHHNELISAARQANIHSFITSLPQGYDTPVGDKGTHLSGGQKQRVAIARAILRNPKILLLDEATSALDSESEKVVQDALDEARKGRTCLIIAHRLSTIQNADIILVIHNGTIVEKGTHQELLRLKGHYYNLQNILGHPY